MMTSLYLSNSDHPLQECWTKQKLSEQRTDNSASITLCSVTAEEVEAELAPILPSFVPKSQRSIQDDLALLDSKLSPFRFEKSCDIYSFDIPFKNMKISHFQTPDNISRKLSRLESSVTMPSWHFSPSSPRETSGSKYTLVNGIILVVFLVR